MLAPPLMLLRHSRFIFTVNHHTHTNTHMCPCRFHGDVELPPPPQTLTFLLSLKRRITRRREGALWGFLGLFLLKEIS